MTWYFSSTRTRGRIVKAVKVFRVLAGGRFLWAFLAAKIAPELASATTKDSMVTLGNAVTPVPPPTKVPVRANAAPPIVLGAEGCVGGGVAKLGTARGAVHAQTVRAATTRARRNW